MSIYDIVDEALGFKLTRENFGGLNDLPTERINRILGAFNDLSETITETSPYGELATIDHPLTEAELTHLRAREHNRVLASPTLFFVPPTRPHQVRHFYPLDLGMSAT